MPEQRDRGCLSPICPLGPPVDAVVARMGGKKHSRKVANCRRTQQDTVTKRGFLADTSYHRQKQLHLVIHTAQRHKIHVLQLLKTPSKNVTQQN